MSEVNIENAVDETERSGVKGLHKTYLGRWLTLFRVQSLPISTVVVSLGYLIAAEAGLNSSMWGFLAVVALGHASINGLNDFIDFETDKENKKPDKPLISGDITPKQALFISVILGSISVLLSFVWFELVALLYTISFLAGLLYNFVSSTRWWSPFVFGVWGASLSMFGSLLGGGIGIPSLFLSITFFLVMSGYIYLGNIIDIEADEVSIHTKTGGTIETQNGKKYHTPGIDFSNEVSIIFTVWLFFSLWFGIWSGIDTAGMIGITGLMGAAAYKFIKLSCKPIRIDNGIKKDFLGYVILTCTFTLVLFSPFAGIREVGILFIASMLWASLSMKLLYGRFLYFP